MTSFTEKQKKSGQKKFIIVDTLEYFVYLLVSDAFLAYLLKSVNISDRLTGIITSFGSLACIAQLVTMMIVRPGMKFKRFTTLMVFFDEILFVLLYMVPSFKVSGTVKAVLFIVFMISAEIMLQMLKPVKLVWQMSFVDNDKCGKYNAVKEMISLVTSMAFSLIMGSVADKFIAAGKMNVGFNFCAITIGGLSIAEVLLLVFSKEPATDKSDEKREKSSLILPFKVTFGNKVFRKLAVTTIILNFARYFSISYYGVYQKSDLGFSLTYCNIILIIACVARTVLSPFAGKFADKHSWARCMSLFMIIMAFSFAVNIFTVPQNGSVMFLIYSILQHSSLAGTSAAMWNVTFDYMDYDARTSAVSAILAVGGISGFIGALCGGQLLNSIQQAENTFLGIEMYPQQLLSAISAILMFFAIVYNILIVEKMPNKQS